MSEQRTGEPRPYVEACEDIRDLDEGCNCDSARFEDPPCPVHGPRPEPGMPLPPSGPAPQDYFIDSKKWEAAVVSPGPSAAHDSADGDPGSGSDPGQAKASTTQRGESPSSWDATRLAVEAVTAAVVKAFEDGERDERRRIADFISRVRDDRPEWAGVCELLRDAVATGRASLSSSVAESQEKTR